jgi:hypothetical protein
MEYSPFLDRVLDGEQLRIVQIELGRGSNEADDICQRF